MISMRFIHVKNAEHVPKDCENTFLNYMANFIPEILTFLLKK